MFGKVNFAKDLGGDCLECREISDGNIFFLIGDVSGHGVGSALLMAYIKACVSLWCRENRNELSSLAIHLEHLLKSLKAKRQFLSVFLGILNIHSHTLNFSACGHPFPLLKRKNEEPFLIGSPNYPLGSRKKLDVPLIEEVSLFPGDLVFCYTDGLVEIRNKTGEEMGYSRIKDWFHKHPENTPEYLVKNLENFYSSFSRIRDDDVSMFFIHRKEEDIHNDAP